MITTLLVWVMLQSVPAGMSGINDPNCYFRQLGTQVMIPRNHGQTVKIPRWSPPIKTSSGIAAASAGIATITNLAEITAAAQLSGNKIPAGANVSGSLRVFGGYRKYTDQLIAMHATDFFEPALESLSRESAFDIDQYTRAQISANTNWQGSSGAASGAVKTVLKAADLARVASRLNAYNAPRFADDNYVAVIHPFLEYDLFTELCSNGWNAAVRYGGYERIYRGEIGRLYGVRVLAQNSLPLFAATNGLSATGASGFLSYIFAQDAFYSLELEGGGVEVIHQPPGSSGAADPLANLGTIAVKFWYGVASTPAADFRMIRLMSGTTLKA